MKKTIKLAVVAALALGTTSVYATNGINLIGVGAKSRAMGGVGLATNLNGENGYSNPSMITRSKTGVVNVGVTYFSPSVSVETPSFDPNTGAQTQLSEDSAQGASFLPSIGYSTSITDDIFIGVSVYGAAGMGVDYTDAKNFAGGFKDSLSVATFAVPLAYTISGFSIGIAPVMKYGSLVMPDPKGTQPGDTVNTSSTGFGVEIGADYEISGFTVAGVYKSAVDIEYKDVFSSGPKGDNHTLATPSVIGLGLSYTMDANTIAFDYKNIGYGSATGLEDFGWENQSVFALGYQYAAEAWAVRAGFNYGATPFSTNEITDASTEEAGQTMGNLMAFPAVTETHITLGGSWNINKNNSIDLAGVYGMGTAKADIAANAFGSGSKAGSVEAVNNQISLTAGYNYNF